MGRYVPPDQEGLISGNRLRGVRAQKSTSDGVPIVRFEMPFAVWCDGCEARTIGRDGKTHPVLIGQGVRFNAEKHRTGNYHSTPIWTFRMRHPACGTMLSIRTDPATTSYLVAGGGRRRREYSDDDDGDLHRGGEVEGGPGPGPGEANPEWDRLDAFDRLERTIQHRMPVTAPTDGSSEADSSDTQFSGLDAEKRLSALTTSNARQWDDPYARNCALRAAFRVGRHAREQAAADDDGLRKRLGGLSEDLQLLPATDADARHAALIDFGSSSLSGGATPSAVADRRTLAKPLLFDNQRGPRDRVSSAPALVGAPMSISMPELPRTASPLSSRNWTHAATTETAKRQRTIREHLASTVIANTRLTTDPFVAAMSNGGGSDASFGKKPTLKGLKRSATETDLVRQSEKREDSKRQRLLDEDKEDGAALEKTVSATLVSYDSD